MTSESVQFLLLNKLLRAMLTMHWLLELLILAATISELGMFCFSKTAKYCARDALVI